MAFLNDLTTSIQSQTLFRLSSKKLPPLTIRKASTIAFCITLCGAIVAFGRSRMVWLAVGKATLPCPAVASNQYVLIFALWSAICRTIGWHILRTPAWSHRRWRTVIGKLWALCSVSASASKEIKSMTAWLSKTTPIEDSETLHKATVETAKYLSDLPPAAQIGHFWTVPGMPDREFYLIW